MGKYLEKAKELRNDPGKHYNCAQAILCAFAPDSGLTEEQSCGVGANFGNGMKMAATCGAVTGGLMVLGMFGETCCISCDQEKKSLIAAVTWSSLDCMRCWYTCLVMLVVAWPMRAMMYLSGTPRESRTLS